MGYHLSLFATTQNNADRMHRFLETTALEWEFVAKAAGLPQEYYGSAGGNENLPPTLMHRVYREGKTEVQISYSSGLGGWERVYFFTLIRWAAIRVGRSRRKFQHEHGKSPSLQFDDPIPYWVYDGDTDNADPIIVCDNWTEAKRWKKVYRYYTVDHLGVRLDPYCSSHISALLDQLTMSDREDARAYFQRRHQPRVGEYNAWKEKTNKEVGQLFAADLKRGVKTLREYLASLDEDWKQFNE